MRKITCVVLVIFLITAVVYFLIAKPSLSKIKSDARALVSAIIQKGQLASKPKEEPKRPERIGEKISYDVKLGKITLGKAKYTHLPNVELDGKQASHMTFETRLARFTDLEKIYSDPDTLLPIKIERAISAWPVSEKITERYDQKNFTLTITKHKSARERQLLVKKDSPIHNAVMLPFYLRCMDAIDAGWSMDVNLPNQKFEIKLVSIEEVIVPAGSFKAYHFKSSPEQFEVWVSADERKIPVKIKGNGALGYALLMREYSI